MVFRSFLHLKKVKLSLKNLIQGNRYKTVLRSNQKDRRTEKYRKNMQTNSFIKEDRVKHIKNLGKKKWLRPYIELTE